MKSLKNYSNTIDTYVVMSSITSIYILILFIWAMPYIYSHVQETRQFDILDKYMLQLFGVDSYEWVDSNVDVNYK